MKQRKRNWHAGLTREQAEEARHLQAECIQAWCKENPGNSLGYWPKWANSRFQKEPLASLARAKPKVYDALRRAAAVPNIFL
jgi:hypothetical protein